MELDYKAIGKRVKIARIKSDDLLCDSVVKAKVQFEQDIALVLEDCDEYEIRMVRDMAIATKETLRRDAHLRKQNDC